MKISEVRQNINEDIWDWFGGGASTIKSALGKGSGGTPEQQRVLDMFIKDFVGDAYSSLNQAIEGGLVDPNVSAAATGTEKPATGATPAAEPTAPAAQPTAPAATAKPAAKFSQGGYGSIRTNAPAGIPSVPKVPGAAAPAIAPKQQPQGQAMDLDAYKKRREAERAAGVQSQQAAQTQMQQTAAANAAASAADNQLVARVRAEKQKPGFQQDKGLIRQAALKGIHESKHKKMKKLFESSLLMEAESISSFLKNRWFPTYMKKVPYDSATIDPLIAAVEQTWKTDKGQAALKKLASAAYAISKTAGGRTEPSAAPAGPSATAPVSGGGQPGVAGDAATIQKSIMSNLQKLKSSDPAAYAQFIKTLKP